jgi:hypothetical protein
MISDADRPGYEELCGVVRGQDDGLGGALLACQAIATMTPR